MLKQLELGVSVDVVVDGFIVVIVKVVVELVVGTVVVELVVGIVVVLLVEVATVAAPQSRPMKFAEIICAGVFDVENNACHPNLTAFPAVC